MKPAVLAGPLVGPLTAGKAMPMESFAVTVVAAAAVVGEIAAEVAAVLELVEVRVAGSAVVVAAAVLAVDEECYYSSSIGRRCWQAVGRLIE
jgi:hypothetical protein